MTTLNEASNFAYGIIEAKANELMDDSLQLSFDNGLLIAEIESVGEEVAGIREIIEANQRYLEDLIGTIKFKNGQIENNNRVIGEIDSLVLGLREQLENFPHTPRNTPKAKRSPEVIAPNKVWVDILIQAEKNLIPYMSGSSKLSLKDLTIRVREVRKFCKIFDDVKLNHGLTFPTIKDEIRKAGWSKDLPAKRAFYFRKYGC